MEMEATITVSRRRRRERRKHLERRKDSWDTGGRLGGLHIIVRRIVESTSRILGDGLVGGIKRERDPIIARKKEG